MANPAKRGFNYIRGAKTLPMGGWKPVECEQFFPIFLQRGPGLRILRPLDFRKDVEGLFRGRFGLGPPELL